MVRKMREKVVGRDGERNIGAIFSGGKEKEEAREKRNRKK